MARLILDEVSARLWLGFALVPLLVGAQTNSSPIYPPNRFLLIVETSHSMQRRLDALSQSVHEVVDTAVAAQAHRSDSLGVWTFNEELHTGSLPLQQWSPETRKAIADRVTGFVRAQKFEKGTRFEKVTPALERVVRNSPFITVILVCLGEADIHGTPFDQRINDFLRAWHSQQQNSAAPFVIALRAQAGRWVDCSMNPSPWPAELPALPKELLVPISPPAPVVKDSPKPASAPVPPLIISGKRKDIPPPVTAPENLPATNAVAASSAAPVINPVQPPALPANTAPLAPADKSSNAAASAAPIVEATPQTANVSTPRDPTEPAPKSSLASPAAVNPERNPITEQTPEHPPVAAPKPKTVENPPVEVATTGSFRKPGYSVIAGGFALLFVLAAAGAMLIRRRQARGNQETSLITESIDRRKK